MRFILMLLLRWLLLRYFVQSQVSPFPVVLPHFVPEIILPSPPHFLLHESSKLKLQVQAVYSPSSPTDYSSNSPTGKAVPSSQESVYWPFRPRGYYFGTAER